MNLNADVEFWTDLVIQAIETATKPLRDRIKALEARAAELEKDAAHQKTLPKGWNHCGPWKPGVTYNSNDVVTFQGSSWIAKEKNVVRSNDPTTGHTCWTLMVKAGRDGKDLR